MYFKIPYTLQIIPIAFRYSNIFSGFTFRNSEYKDLSSKYFFLTSNKSVHTIKTCLTVIVEKSSPQMQQATKERRHSLKQPSTKQPATPLQPRVNTWFRNPNHPVASANQNAAIIELFRAEKLDEWWPCFPHKLKRSKGARDWWTANKTVHASWRRERYQLQSSEADHIHLNTGV